MITELTKEQSIIRNILIDVASKKHTIFYSDLIQRAKLNLDMCNPNDRGIIGDLLGVVSQFEFEHDRPLLSSVVVSVNNEQGDGFFKLAEELGFGDWKKLKKEQIFEFNEMNKTHDYWSQNKQ